MCIAPPPCWQPGAAIPAQPAQPDFARSTPLGKHLTRAPRLRQQSRPTAMNTRSPHRTRHATPTPTDAPPSARPTTLDREAAGPSPESPIPGAVYEPGCSDCGHPHHRRSTGDHSGGDVQGPRRSTPIAAAPGPPGLGQQLVRVITSTDHKVIGNLYFRIAVYVGEHEPGMQQLTRFADLRATQPHYSPDGGVDSLHGRGFLQRTGSLGHSCIRWAARHHRRLGRDLHPWRVAADPLTTAALIGSRHRYPT